MSNRAQLRAQARQSATHGARQKIVAQRAAQQRRRRLLLVGGSILGVIAIVGTLIGVKLTGKPPAVSTTATANAAVASAITSVPASTLNAAGTGSGTATPLRTIAGHQPLLTSGGKPEVFYVGAEYCPFCAAERWALTVALSRFGTFSRLHFIHSSSTDYYPDTPTLTFYKSSYTSKYLTFDPVELETETRAPLQQFTASQNAIFDKYDAPPYVPEQSKLTYPFVDFGNQALVSGAQYSPGTLSGLTWSQVAAAIKNPASTIGKEVNGAANMITAELCKLTGGQPGSVCSSAGVKAAS
jgi:thiol-disulfide isomerase/thioredoxin